MSTPPADAAHNRAGWRLERGYAQLPVYFFTRCAPVPVRSPRVVMLNNPLASSLGLDFSVADNAERAALFSGNQLPPGAEPLALAYAGHQFGHFTMLGDGRAHLLGEYMTPGGARVDIQLKGSGQTPYSRRGDGRAALGPMLREYIISEAMHALGIPTTRSLAVVTTGEPIMRETLQQGAILTRVAASHVRVGTFEFAAAQEDADGLKQLADMTIARHYPHLATEDAPYAALLQAVVARQAALVAQWLCVGFVHGVMNTDNMALSGETIDYGPCAFMDTYDPATVFSSIDHQGRYAYANQPRMAQWNLARLAEAMLPLLGADHATAIATAEAIIDGFAEQFQQHWQAGMRRKLGLAGHEPEDAGLIAQWLQWMQRHRADYTLSFRDLGHDTLPPDARYQEEGFIAWHTQWRARRDRHHAAAGDALRLMQASNPAIIARNYRVEEALQAATEEDYSPMEQLLAALRAPYHPAPEHQHYQLPPPADMPAYQTFCGT